MNGDVRVCQRVDLKGEKHEKIHVDIVRYGE